MALRYACDLGEMGDMKAKTEVNTLKNTTRSHEPEEKLAGDRRPT